MPVGKKMSLVMPAYKSAKTIRKALESLFDQDYKNFEVLVVLDGEDGYRDEAYKVAQAVAKKAVTDKQIKSGQYKICVTTEHVGACAARNMGAEKATGDYISFFSSDFVAEPGMLRRWIEAFEDNPDADMIYGGYRFWDQPGKPAMYSQPFDLYALTCYNYIDGGFPVKREWWEKHKWDEDFKSLNDWEWILRMCLDGMKPVFIPDFTYSAQTPQSGGLSHDSSKNWLERVGQIKKKHGIPDRPISFCSLDYHEEASKLARAMGQDVQRNPSYKPNNYKLVYMIGFNLQAADQCAEMLGPVDGAKKVIHWMPADIRKLKQAKIIDLEHLAASFRDFKLKSFACTAEDVKFLQHYGFNVALRYYFAWNGLSVNGHDFKAWLPAQGFEDVEKGMPDIPITRSKGDATAELLLDAPWGEIAEAMMAGKHVVTNAPFFGVRMVSPQKTYPELKTAIVNALRGIRGKKYGDPYLMGEYKNLCNERKFRKELKKLCR